MTHKEAATILQGFKKKGWCISKLGTEALEMAIVALEQPEPKWISCNWHKENENLPDEGKSVLIFIEGGLIDVSYRFDYNRWERYGRVNVKAWMPLPEPYQERRADERMDV